MPKEFSRSRRVGELLQRELAVLIPRELSDPRIGMVTVTEVTVSRDLTAATVYVTRLVGKGDEKELVTALNHAAGHLRHCLSGSVALRGIPSLRFKYDESVERGAALARKLEALDTPPDPDS